MAHSFGVTDPEDLPDRPSDEIGWGDEPREDKDSASDEWYLAERPPHHGT